MIQIDMDMPKRCIDCPLLQNIKTIDGLWFYVCNCGRMRILFEHEGTKEAVDTLVESPKPQWCPLKEAEPKNGKWIPDNEHVQCSACQKKYDWTSEAQYYKFCPNCGAKMEE